MQSAETVLKVIRDRGQRGLPVQRLYRQLVNPDLYRRARALVFPGEEDFGITPLEAQATGRPVIAFGRGGALETVTPDTGILFESQTVESLVEALRQFDAFEASFDPQAARTNAARFSKPAFQRAFLAQVERMLDGRDAGPGVQPSSELRRGEGSHTSLG